MIKDRFLTKYIKKKSYQINNLKNLSVINKYKNSFFYLKTYKKIKKIHSNYINTVKIFELNVKKTTHLKNYKKKYLIRNYKKKDKKQILNICKNSYPNSRFVKDFNISNEFKKNYIFLWLRNFFLGKRGNNLIVAEKKNGTIIGFCLVLVSGSNIQIDQIIVKENQRNKGIASHIMRHILLSKKVKKLIAGTDASNTFAIKLYRGLGFKFKKSYHNYHFHT